MKLLIWIISWIISALLLFPCVILSVLSGFKFDYHLRFQYWWFDKILKKL